MLVLGRKEGESLVITTPAGERVTIRICAIRGNTVRVGVTAPRDYEVLREEIASAGDERKAG